jgi:hypothetical protein
MFILKFVGTFLYPENYERNCVMGYIWKNAAIVDQRRTQRPSYTPTRKSGYFMGSNTVFIEVLPTCDFNKK